MRQLATTKRANYWQDRGGDHFFGWDWHNQLRDRRGSRGRNVAEAVQVRSRLWIRGGCQSWLEGTE